LTRLSPISTARTSCSRLRLARLSAELDNILGNGNQPYKIDYFSIVAHEIGHALGLDHSDGLPGPSIMDSVNRGEFTGPSASDVSLIQELYPPPAGNPSRQSRISPWRPTRAVGRRCASSTATRNSSASLLRSPLHGRRSHRRRRRDRRRRAGPHYRGGAGRRADIHVYDGRNGALIRQFFAYDPNFTGGCYVAAATFNHDGHADIIIGADAGGGPNVVSSAAPNNSQLYNFFAYDMRFTGGVRVGAGDTNGDGFADIACGAGPGGGPNVTVFSGRDGSRLQSFLPTTRASRPAFTSRPRTSRRRQGRRNHRRRPRRRSERFRLSGADASVLLSFFPYDPISPAACAWARPGFGTTGNVIVTVPGPGGPPKVSLYDRALRQLDSFFAFDALFTGGGL